MGLDRNYSNMTKHICPNCKSGEVSAVYYSCPPQTDCAKCNTHYEYGQGIRIIGLAEGIKLRPQMYKEYVCKTCGKYTGPYKMEELSEEDKLMLCICKKDKPNDK